MAPGSSVDRRASGLAKYDRQGDDLQARGLYLDEPPWKARIFSLTKNTKKARNAKSKNGPADRNNSNDQKQKHRPQTSLEFLGFSMESGLNVVSEGTGDCKSRLAKYYNPGSTKNMIPDLNPLWSRRPLPFYNSTVQQLISFDSNSSNSSPRRDGVCYSSVTISFEVE